MAGFDPRGFIAVGIGVIAGGDLMAAEAFYVYVHSRLSSGEPFYVGKGHGDRVNTHKSRSDHWKNIVSKDGGRYANIIVGNMDEELAFLVEMESIDKYRRLGVRLANKTDGGDGVSGYRNPNGAWNKGMPVSEEMKARISSTLKANGCLPPIGWNKGKKTPPEVLEKKRLAMIAVWEKAKADGSRTTSIETRAKQRASKIGHVKSNETRRKLSDALKANKYARTRPDMTGFKHTEESRAKMSASAKMRRKNV